MKIRCPESDEIVDSEECEHFKKEYPAVIRNILIKAKRKRKPREGPPQFGVGRLVKNCMRQAYYELTEEQVFSPEKLWIFERGHAIHNHIQAPLEDGEKEIFKKVKFPLFNVIGFIDAVHDGVLYEFKTTSNIPVQPQSHHILQAQGYFSMLDPEEQEKISKILIVYASLKAIKTFEIPKRNVLAYLESRGAILANALSTHKAPPETAGWLCKFCDFKDKCNGAAGVQKKLDF
jgi:CRISPR/Cas system-associated exonuclease Cas4 (RecB family)